MSTYISWIRSHIGHDKMLSPGAVGCITNEKKQLLFHKRAGYENAWGFPGGGLELGESAEEAVVREIFEETGLTVKVDRLQGVYTKYTNVHPNGDIAQPILIAFQCSIVNGELNPFNDETKELKFFNLDELPRLYNEQHCDILEDFLHNRTGVYR